MEILKCLIGLIVVLAPFVLMYGMGRLSIGKQYNEDTDFVDVMIAGSRAISLIVIGILVLVGCYMVGNEIIK